jgi:hypothetical protein
MKHSFRSRTQAGVAYNLGVLAQEEWQVHPPDCRLSFFVMSTPLFHLQAAGDTEDYTLVYKALEYFQVCTSYRPMHLL